MIIRVFHAHVHPGKGAEFRKFFLTEALPLVRAQEGLVRAEIGWPMPPTEEQFVMITTWRDVDSLRAFAGDDWRQARILPAERPLLRDVTVHHYEAASV